ncbi:hypothetical protein [Vibrio phage BUCT006]|nr:hypothetical protein [Vibrio phage BUCT006]
MPHLNGLSIYDLAEIEAEPYRPKCGKVAEQALFASDYLESECDGFATIAAIRDFKSCFGSILDLEDLVLLVRYSDIQKRKVSNEKVSN